MSGRDWSIVRPLLDGVDGAPISGVDQLGAYSRDVFAALDVDVRDEDELFVVFSTFALLMTCATNAESAGSLCAHGSEDLRGVISSVATALAQFAPEGARA